MTMFPDILCRLSPRELDFPRTKLTGGWWLEHGATTTIEVWPHTKEEFDKLYEFLLAADGDGFVMADDLRNTRGEKNYQWRVVGRPEKYEDHGHYAKVKFTAQVIGVLGDEVPCVCSSGEEISCSGVPLTTYSPSIEKFPRRVQ